jgi:hypothetical protein
MSSVGRLLLEFLHDRAVRNVWKKEIRNSFRPIRQSFRVYNGLTGKIYISKSGLPFTRILTHLCYRQYVPESGPRNACVERSLSHQTQEMLFVWRVLGHFSIAV